MFRLDPASDGAKPISSISCCGVGCDRNDEQLIAFEDLLSDSIHVKKHRNEQLYRHPDPKTSTFGEEHTQTLV